MCSLLMNFIFEIACTFIFDSDVSLVPEKREDKFPVFMEWLKNNKVDVGCVDIHSFPGLGYGLQATKDLKVI